VRTRIGTQLIVGMALATALSVGLMALVITRQHERQLIAERTREADQLSETIKSSTHYDMLENRREGLHREIEIIGRQEGIERVRVFNKEGVIMFSSDAAEIGRSLDTKAEACYACHAAGRPLEKLPIAARTREFRGPDGTRTLGIINPIHNESTCSSAACHAHRADQAVLGVLDVTVSLAEVEHQIRQSRLRMGLLALLTILASAVLLWWLNRRLVVRPVQALAQGTRRIARGDLTTTIPVAGDHELADLARAFNEMTRQLAEAQNQILRAQKQAAVGRLAAGVAHEINNPLTGVLTYASLLLKQAERQPELRGDLEVIVRETKRCREIVKGLLDFARQTPPKMQPADLNEAVRRAVAVAMNQLRLDRVALELDLAGDLPRVAADMNQMQQVLLNLLLNAVDAIGAQGGRIRIGSRCLDRGPWGHATIDRATCPRGCDLLDGQVRIRSLPSIHVVTHFNGEETSVHLDPVYGRFSHLSSAASEQRIESATCPRCHASLDWPTGRCDDCGAPTFAVQVPDAGHVEWCRRKGCHWSHWEAAEAKGPRPVVEIVVEDSGCGIPAEALPNLFEPFFTTKGTRGTGLGLAVSWGIVAGHGGSIEVESVPNTGSKFTVRLPVLSEETAVSSAA
jgi:two-component system NtrC family sensor kinase